MQQNEFTMYKTFLMLACSILLYSTDLAAQSASNHDIVPEEFLHTVSYRSVGPTRGGRVTAVEGVASQPFTFYMGPTGGGIWKTTDAGLTWNPVSDGQIKAGSIGAIAVAPSASNVVYVGTGSACPRGNVSAGIGLYKSENAGGDWSFIGLPNAGQIGKIIVHPNDPDKLYVAALGQIFGPNKERGIFYSEDGGQNWQHQLYVSDSTGAIDMAMNPQNPKEMYAAFWRAERKPWTLVDGGTEGGIWKTTDGGKNWKKLGGNGLPSGLLGRIGLAVSPVNPQRVWAIIMAAEEEDAGLYRSDDSGKTWKRINRDHKLRQRGWYYSHITAHPTDENTVYVNNVNFYKSIDGGKTFDHEIDVPHGDNHGLWINPNQPDIMIHCNDGGATVSLNGGDTWTSEYNQPTSEFYRVTVDNQFPYRLYAGQQDNSTISVPSQPVRGVTPFENWFSVGGSESADVAVHPENPNIIWAGSYSGEITVMNRATGQVREVTAYPHYTEGTEQRALKYRWQWNFPILISKFDPNVVYMGSNYVHKTTNEGQDWSIISPDLTRKLDQYHGIPGGPIQHDATGVEVYSSIFALEESPHQQGELWAGSDDGLLHLSKDGGQTWTNITPPGMPFEGTINKIELSTHAPGRAFVAVYNYRYNDFKPYLYLTNDYGKNWKLLTDGKNGIPDNHFVRAIAEDPDRKGLLYAGTEFGMYISFDEGKDWQSFQLNLPHVPVTDIEVHEQDLVLSTQGRAFWVVDDLTPLHQISDNISLNKHHFFQPRPVYRTDIGNGRATLKAVVGDAFTAKTPVSLKVIDEKGNIIRSYASDASNRLNKISLKKGVATFHWDLRHQGPFLVDNLVTMVIRNPSPGPRAVPGVYTLELQIGDWTDKQNLTILPDPRWTDVTQDDYEAQLTKGLEIRDILTDAHQRIENIRSIRKQIEMLAELSTTAGYSEQLMVRAVELAAQLTAVEDQLIQNKAEASQDNINYPRVFSNRMGRLYSVVIGDHNRPTGGMEERSADLDVVYEDIVKAYDEVMDKQVPRFNELLLQENVPRLIMPGKMKP